MHFCQYFFKKFLCFFLNTIYNSTKNSSIRLHTPEDGVSMEWQSEIAHTRRWALALIYYYTLIYYYRSILCYYWSSTVKSFTTTPHTFLKVFCRLVEDMDRSPMKNNPRPTLRGTSTYFRGSPGVERVRE